MSREAVQTAAIRDPITGVFTPQYLLTEGRKHFSHAKRHGGPLSIVILRIDSYAEIEQAVGPRRAPASCWRASPGCSPRRCAPRTRSGAAPRTRSP